MIHNRILFISSILLCILSSTVLSLPISSPVPKRRVNWYMSSGAITANIQFLQNNSNAITGFYMCCNSFTFEANGTFTGMEDEQLINQTSPLLMVNPNLELLYVIGISNISIYTGSWVNGIEAAVDTLDRLSSYLHGYIVDYEPSYNYSLNHSQAYANFLGAFKQALEKRNKLFLLGTDVAGWGILDKYSILNSSNLDIYTSMTPTYFGTNLSLNEQFVLTEISSFPINSIGIGIGSMLAPNEKPEWNYNYTETSLSSFLQFLINNAINRVDIWRADIDHYSTTVDYYFTLLQQFLTAP